MGFRILGAPEETVLLSLQGDVTLSLTPASGLTFNSFAPVGDPPRLSDFDNYIDTYGPDHAANKSSDWQNYDGDRVHRFLADYTGETATYMPASASIRDEYWIYTCVNNTSPTAYLQYPLGFYYWVQDTGYSGGSNVNYSSVAEAFAGWADDSNYTHRNKSQKPNDYHHAFNREVAYNLLTLVFGERLVGATNFNNLLGYSGNYPLDYRYALLLGKADNHLRQWRTNTFNSPSYGSGNDWHYMNPFMVAITCYCLMQYYDLRGNENWGDESWEGTPYWADIPTAVEDMLTWMYNEAPNHKTGGDFLLTNYAGAGTYDAFPYIDREGSAEGGDADGASPELNMLLAPCYAWLGKHYNDSSYVTNYADRLFGGLGYHLSTSEASWWATNTTKQYNQLFVWAQEYFTWRQQV